jgi:hypothetical protein
VSKLRYIAELRAFDGRVTVTQTPLIVFSDRN